MQEKPAVAAAALFPNQQFAARCVQNALCLALQFQTLCVGRTVQSFGQQAETQIFDATRTSTTKTSKLRSTEVLTR